MKVKTTMPDNPAANFNEWWKYIYSLLNAKKIVLLLLFSTSILLAIAQDKCKATKKDGTPCKAMGAKSTGLCFAHSANTIRCGAMTTKKLPCKQLVKQAGDKCRYHKG